MCSDPILFPPTRKSADAIPSHLSCRHANELCSKEIENIPKARKPYTISKQREKWTEDEHNKFLEALRLYGRAWRRIEEHIGTKNAVQIRSHAQKFFSKVVRESADSSNCSMKPDDIPPPRPKRKPVHPYPRKLGSTSNKQVKVMHKPGKPTMLRTESFSERENKSPKSVLSAFASSMLGLPSSDLGNHKISSDSYSLITSSSDSELTEQEIGRKLQPSLPEESGCHPAPSVSDALISGCKPDVEPNPVPHKTSFKLFGRTVPITESDGTKTSIVGDTMQHDTPSHLAGESSNQTDEDNHQPTPIITQVEDDTQKVVFDGVNTGRSWNPWNCRATALYCCLSPQLECADAARGTSTPLFLWAISDGMAFPLCQTPGLFSQRCPDGPPEQHSYTKQMQNGSWSDSNASVSSGEAGTKEISSVDQEKSYSFAGPKLASEKQPKGFVPYKRSSVRRDEQEERQRIRLC